MEFPRFSRRFYERMLARALDCGKRGRMRLRLGRLGRSRGQVVQPLRQLIEQSLKLCRIATRSGLFDVLDQSIKLTQVISATANLIVAVFQDLIAGRNVTLLRQQ